MASFIGNVFMLIGWAIVTISAVLLMLPMWLAEQCEDFGDWLWQKGRK